MLVHSFLLSAVLCGLRAVRAVTIYGIEGPMQQTAGAGAATATLSNAVVPTYTAPAFNNVVLQPPPVPSPPVPTQFGLTLQTSASNLQGLSIPQSGAFFGFSIEFSVVNQVVGINASYIQVSFLNLMSLLTARGGAVHIRVGGNTQDYATLVDSLPDGKAIEKDKTNTTNPTQTPTLLFTPEILYMLANVSSLVNTKWYLGIPFNDTTNLRLGIAEAGEAILGNNLLGFQMANEPDLYAGHLHRPPTYSPMDFFNEFGAAIQVIDNNAQIPVKNNLIAPSVATGAWTPEMVWSTGFIEAYSNSLGALSVEHYPDDNCAQAFPGQGFQPKDPQVEFANYLNHTSGQSIVGMYLNSTNIAQQNGKPFLMMETNTASCGGFPGISDAFGAALWAIDYGMQMAYSNFSGALLHVGGESDTYNPFTPPPTNMSAFEQWTVGPTFYATLVVAEAFGTSNTSQIIDLEPSADLSIFTPAYAIYENGNLARVALFNYVTDPSGSSTYTASITFADGSVPSQVSVKYLAAPSVSEKINITWAGQTLSGIFQSDGRLRGEESITTIQCDTNANSCSIPVPAPAFALVFLSSDAFSESSPSSVATFPTTAMTKTQNVATVPASVLATSNGQSGANRSHIGSTSQGRVSGAGKALDISGLLATLVAAPMLFVAFQR